MNLENMFSQTKLNSILYTDPFLKAGFIAKVVQNAKIDVLYLDFDLLYSGYLASEMLIAPQTLSLFQPTIEIWNQTLTSILVKLSMKKSLVIVDSLNGLFNMLNERKEIGKLVTSYIMMLQSMAQITNSYVLVASMVRFKKKEGWVLTPTGKRFLDTNKAKKILLKQKEGGIVLDFLNKEKIFIPANSIPL
ncbi:MAG: hypothetical protein ACREAF_04140 [Nitrosopumilaceae archaeon]